MVLDETGLEVLWDRMKEYVDAYVSLYDSLAVATENERGQVRPDGTTITVDADGTIHGSSSASETDPTVPAWAKEDAKPTYTAQEVGALPDTTFVPTKTSHLENDSGYVTEVPTKTSELENDSGYVTSVPTKTSELENDSGYVTSVPTKTSELENDSGYVTEVPTATSSTLGIVRPDGTTIAISDGVISAVSPSVTPMRYRGEVSYTNYLPASSTNRVGDLCSVRITNGDLMRGTMYIWTGSQWVAVKGDAAPRVSTLDSTGYSPSHEFAVLGYNNTYYRTSIATLANGVLETHEMSDLLTDAKNVVGAINELYTKGVDLSQYVTRDQLSSYVTLSDLDEVRDENESLRHQVASLRKRLNALAEIVDPDGLSVDFVDGDVTIDGAGVDFSDGDVTIDSASAEFADGSVYI